MGFEETGIITISDLKKYGLMPSIERLRRGPVALIECVQGIPCDVCIYVCPFKAILKRNISDVPRIDYDKCIGCGNCVLMCPGLAIFIIDLSMGDGYALITLPYEMLPKPRVGLKVELLGRDGGKLGYSRIIRVVRSRDKTYAVTVKVRENLAMDVRGIRVILDG